MYKSLYHGIDLTKLADRRASVDIFQKEVTKKKEHEEEIPKDKFALQVLFDALTSSLLGCEEPIITDSNLAHVASYLDEIIGGKISDPRLTSCVKQLTSMEVIVTDYKPIYGYFSKIEGIIAKICNKEIPIYNRDYAEKVLGLKFNDAHKDGYIYSI